MIKNLLDFPYNDKWICNLKKPEYRMKHRREVRAFYNIPFSIDIETTSTYDENGEKISFPYCYQVGFNHTCYITRDYKIFYDFIRRINERLERDNMYIMCLIHNLPYEFNFFFGFMNFTEVFARSNAKPLTAECGRIRFMDSFAYSNYSLEKLSDKYTKTKKMKDLDYKKYRVPETPLTEEELRYCADDVIILNEYWDSDEIQRYINKVGFSKPPLTNTSKIRIFTKQHITNMVKYRSYLQDIYPEEDTWKMLDNAFMGGIVKSNPYFTNLVLKGLHAKDLTSSYPAQMLKQLYPVSKFVNCKIKQLEEMQEGYCYLFHIRFKNVKSIFPMRIISSSKIYAAEGCRCDNGRIIDADSFEMYLTDVDLLAYRDFYSFEYEILECKYAQAGRLPKFIIKAMTTLYKRKNELKEILELDPYNLDLNVEYLNVKGMLNSMYGMMVTGEKPINFRFINGEWKEEVNKNYHKFKNSDFLSFQWGVWVTAHARRALLDGILICGADSIVYSDTDSCKYMGDREEGFAEYNKKNDILVKEACQYYKIPYEVFEGIGRYTTEPDIITFKTLGSKRYYTETINPKTGKPEEHVTISGIADKRFCDYARKKCGSVLKFFKRSSKIPKEYTGKNTLLYKEAPEGYTYKYEYNGVKHEIPIVGYIHMEEAPWKMELSKEYSALLYKIIHKKGLIK